MGLLNSLMLLFCSAQPHRPIMAAAVQIGLIQRVGIPVVYT
jgi:hypothetical protein